MESIRDQAYTPRTHNLDVIAQSLDHIRQLHELAISLEKENDDLRFRLALAVTDRELTVCRKN